MISDLAALPMQDTRLPLILGIIPIITLLFLKIVLSIIQLKSQKARKFLEGEPTILISRGKIHFENLKRQQINLDELMEELRLAGYFDLDEIEYGILENNGQMSFLTSDKNKNTYMPIIYVLDGKINTNSMTSGGKNKDSIIKELKKHGIDSIENILIAMTDTNGNFFYQQYEEKGDI